MTSIGIVLSLIPMVTWGIGDYLSSLAAKDISPRVANFVFQVAGLPLSFAIALILGLPPFVLSDIAVFLIAGVIFTSGFVLMMKGFTKGAIGVVSPIANAYSAVTVAIAVLVFGTMVSIGQLLAIALIILGIIFVSYEKSSKLKSRRRIQASVFYALLSMLSFGVGFGVLESIDAYTWYQNMLLLHISVVIVAFVDMLIIKKNKAFKEMRSALKYKIGLIGGVLGTVGTLGFFGAYENLGSVVIPAVIASSSPLVTSFIAHRREGERLQLLQRLGGIGVIVGVILLNIV